MNCPRRFRMQERFEPDTLDRRFRMLSISSRYGAII